MDSVSRGGLLHRLPDDLVSLDQAGVGLGQVDPEEGVVDPVPDDPASAGLLHLDGGPILHIAHTHIPELQALGP